MSDSPKLRTAKAEREVWVVEGAPIAVRAESAIAVLHKRIARLCAALERFAEAVKRKYQ